MGGTGGVDVTHDDGTGGATSVLRSHSRAYIVAISKAALDALRFFRYTRCAPHAAFHALP